MLRELSSDAPFDVPCQKPYQPMLGAVSLESLDSGDEHGICLDTTKTMIQPEDRFS